MNIPNLEEIRKHTLLSPGKLSNLHRLAQQMNESGIAGDFVEAGVCRGGSAAILGRALAQRTLWLYDSFQGMPPTEPVDGEEAARCVGMCTAAPEDVNRILAVAGVDRARYRMTVGLFEDTFLPENLPDQVALLHCDADWYASVSIVLETFYPRMHQGACVILDDFGYWEGCREAFYDFCRRHDEKPLLERCESDQAWWIKGRAHNREA